MPDVGSLADVVGERHFVDRTHVEVVGVAGAGTVLVEEAMVDGHRVGQTGDDWRAEDTVLVILEAVVLQHHLPALVADTGAVSAVLVGNRTSGKAAVLHRDVVVDGKDAFLVRRSLRGNEVRHAAHGLDGYLCRDRREVVRVGASVDKYDAAVRRVSGRLRERREHLARTDGKHLRPRCGWEYDVDRQEPRVYRSRRADIGIEGLIPPGEVQHLSSLEQATRLSTASCSGTRNDTQAACVAGAADAYRSMPGKPLPKPDFVSQTRG